MQPSNGRSHWPLRLEPTSTTEPGEADNTTATEGRLGNHPSVHTDQNDTRLDLCTEAFFVDIMPFGGGIVCLPNAIAVKKPCVMRSSRDLRVVGRWPHRDVALPSLLMQQIRAQCNTWNNLP